MEYCDVTREFFFFNIGKGNLLLLGKTGCDSTIAHGQLHCKDVNWTQHSNCSANMTPLLSYKVVVKILFIHLASNGCKKYKIN